MRVCFLQNLRVTSKYFKLWIVDHLECFPYRPALDSTTLQRCHLGFSKKEKIFNDFWADRTVPKLPSESENQSLMDSVSCFSTSSISIVYIDITRGQCLRFLIFYLQIDGRWLGNTMQNECGVCIKSQFWRQLALSWSAANPFQRSPWLKAHIISWCHFHPGKNNNDNEQQIGIDGIEQIWTNWNKPDKAIQRNTENVFVWETFKDLVKTKISAAALSVTERSRSRHSLLNRGPTTSRASTCPQACAIKSSAYRHIAKKIPDIQVTKRGCHITSCHRIFNTTCFFRDAIGVITQPLGQCHWRLAFVFLEV